MRFSSFAAAAAPLAVLAMEAPASGFFEAPGLVRFPISAHRGAGSDLFKRQEQIPLDNQETGYYYTIDIEVGTPPQRVTVFFDTGSGELWVNPNCSTAANPALCNSFGRFGESSSFVDLNVTNILQYGGQRAAIIRYGYDFVTVGSARINQQIFGVALDSSGQPAGILGVGPSLKGWDSPYPYVLDNLYKQNFINSRSFSLDLRPVNIASGAVIFGGVDLKKFTGKLEKRPIIPASESPDKRTRYWIYLDGISITGQDGTTETAIFNSPNAQPVLLDSGYTVSALPKETFSKILAAFPSARKDGTSSQYLVDCSIINTQGSVDFTFGNTTIKVPYRDFVWQQPRANVCVLGVVEATSFPVLGDTFLRAAYAVYDYDNRNIYLANAKDCGSELIAIGSGLDAVPAGLEGQCLDAASSSSLASTLTFATSTSTSSSESASVSASSSAISSPTSEATTNSSTSTSVTDSTLESSLISSSTPETTSTSSSVNTSVTDSTLESSLISSSTPETTSTSSSVSTSAVQSISLTSAISSSTSEPTVTSSSIGTSTVKSTSPSSDISSSIPSSTSRSSATSSSTFESTSTISSNSSSAVESTSTSFISTSASSVPTSSLSASATSLWTSESTPSTLSVSTSISSSSSVLSTGSLTSSSQTEETASSTEILPSSKPTDFHNTKLSTVKVTKTYTITSCAPSITKCPVGQVTTEVTIETKTPEPSHAPQPSSPYVKPDSPQVTSSIAIPQVICPGNAGTDCNSDELVTTSVETVIVPITPIAEPTPIPGCDLCEDEKKTTPSQANSTPAATNIDTQGPSKTGTTEASDILTAIMGPLVEPSISPGRDLPTNITATRPVVATVTGGVERTATSPFVAAGAALAILLQLVLQ